MAGRWMSLNVTWNPRKLVASELGTGTSAALFHAAGSPGRRVRWPSKGRCDSGTPRHNPGPRNRDRAGTWRPAGRRRALAGIHSVPALSEAPEAHEGCVPEGLQGPAPPLRVLPGGQSDAGHGRPGVFLQKIGKISGVSLRIGCPGREFTPMYGGERPPQKRNCPRERRWCRWRTKRNGPRPPRS